ncbi:sodium/hydrogen exchanger family protein [Sorangium cellulosum So ce56]|uniref:Sodium/hydrogen exchanger family protein n=1 Tax=Sorangium cellulosum (strain So ce56) TaxID=448385 RepID=A9F2R0_SORC5|nr:cation:proton antiporter [Sorangium cellulosum]CAN94511.1 sodium/hydrogen exchanger family protein [Sorangium cellulosum So ce56]
MSAAALPDVEPASPASPASPAGPAAPADPVAPAEQQGAPSARHHGSAPKGPLNHLTHAVALVILFGLLYATTRAVPHENGPAGAVASIGFLLLAGTLASELVEPLRLPHISGYIFAGIVAGPHVLKLVDHHAVEEISRVNTLALALIALAGGAELRIDIVKKSLKSILLHNLVQTALVFVVMTGVFYAARSLVPFAAELSTTAAFGVAVLWGVIAVTRSPSAVLGILSQTRATGPVAMHTLAFVMTSDIVVIVVTAVALSTVRPLIEPGATMSMHEIELLGREILGSISIGTTLGLALAAYMRLIGRQLILVFVALGFGATEVLRYLRFDALLVFVVAGFVVANLSKQGEKLVHAVEDAASVVFVLFFATAGAHLDLPLLRHMWPVALLFGVSRALVTWVANRIGNRLADDPPLLRRWSWCGLVSQAGLTLGISLTIERAFPSIGAGFGALVIGCVALNEVFGPILFKYALDRAGETAVEASRGSLPNLGRHG